MLQRSIWSDRSYNEGTLKIWAISYHLLQELGTMLVDLWKTLSKVNEWMHKEEYEGRMKLVAQNHFKIQNALMTFIHPLKPGT